MNQPVTRPDGSTRAGLPSLPDVTVENHGNIFMFFPWTDAAKAWVAEYVQLESWQWLGGGFAVDQHYAAALAEGMQESGLEVR